MNWLNSLRMRRALRKNAYHAAAAEAIQGVLNSAPSLPIGLVYDLVLHRAKAAQYKSVADYIRGKE